MRLQKRKALVTGGGRGIGSAIVLGLAREGCDVVINYVRSGKSAQKIVEEVGKLGRKAFAVRADISRLQDIKRLVSETEKKLGRIDILINNAGISFFEPWSEISERTWDQTLNTNLKGAFFCSQLIAKQMITKRIKGSIINVSSTNGMVAEADVAHYNASKGGLEMLTRSLAIELAPYDIRVNAIAPGIITTEAAMDFLNDAEFREHYRQHIPLKRFGSVDDCVGAVVFFASDESSYITGQSLVIDGGLIIDQCPKLPGK